MSLHEFEIIKQYFTQQSIHHPKVEVGIGDDAAIVTVDEGNKLVITTDTLVSGVHFLSDTSPVDIGYKSLAVNLSDLAAMGATPAWVTLALTLPTADEGWLKSFANGFFECASQFNVQLIGGDLTHGPLSITVCALGTLPKPSKLLRSGAKPGDAIYVTNTLGDAALGLALLQNKIQLAETFHDGVKNKLNRPEPQIEIGKKILDIASAAIDISDGLISDLNHILEASQVGAALNIDDIPLSAALQSIPQDNALAFALTGGDDYELCFTVSPDKQLFLEQALPHDTVAIHKVGVIQKDPKLILQHSSGQPYKGKLKGYEHF